jgi:hypothetical protein
MARDNGTPILRIGRKGKIAFAFGEDGEPFTIDVVDLHNQWSAIDRPFRDPDGKILPDKMEELNGLAYQFVTEVSKMADLSMAEVMEFLAKLTEEFIRLADFFVPKYEKKPSSPEPTELRFST